MPDPIPRPNKSSIVFIDTSALIDYLIGDLEIPGFSGILEKNIREFLGKFIEKQIPLRITTTTKTEAKNWRDLLARKAFERGLPSYLFTRVEQRAKERYDKLRGRIVEDNSDTGNYPSVVTFYTKHQKKSDFIECRRKKIHPTPLPEENDMLTLSQISKHTGPYFIVVDCDFFTMDEEIFNEFRIYILSQNNMNAAIRVWSF